MEEHWENATSMSGDNLIHSTSFDGKSTYLISCRDSYRNKNSECSIVVSGGMLANE